MHGQKYHALSLGACLLLSCAASPLPPTSPRIQVAGPGVPAIAAPAAANVPCASLELAGKAWLTTHEARCLMVALINRDRATMSLPPVELDEGPPTVAGQGHAEDMAVHGFLGHWGTDGSVPEQRFNLAGGSDMVFENASCFTDEAPRTIDPNPWIAASQVVSTESMFFNEAPPSDGHRKNILKSFHKRVGIGVGQPLPRPQEIPVPCFSQEFVDPYGVYAPIPPALRVGQMLHVEGSILAPATVAGVGLARVGLPVPIPVSEANRRRSYPVPAPYQMYWPQGFVTPIPLRVGPAGFAIDVPVSDKGQAGMYELSVWAKLPGEPDFVIVGMRTMRVQ
jgi:uncharacterized protein YkwD